MRFYPLGYPVDIVVSPSVDNSANREAVLEAAWRNWGAWPALFDEAPLRFEIETRGGPAPRDVPRFEAPAGWLRFSAGKHNFAVFELEARTGYMSVGGRALGNDTAFRHHWLEALVLTALDAVFFTPLHAACVAREGSGTLLCGDSGAGKSSLAYACARRGWTLVSDDAVHLAPGPERIGVGGSTFIHLREPARALFPELDAMDGGIAPNGKQAIEIDGEAHGFITARSAQVSQCYFLRRRPGPAVVRPFPADDSIQYFLKYLFPRDTAAAERHLRRSLSPEPRLLEYEHIRDAIEVLEA
jgi:HPr serine kinase-like protein